MRMIYKLAVPVLMLAAAPAQAVTYTKANFSAGIFGGNANVSAPFTTNGFFQGQTFTGNFVFANELVPAPGSGFVNVLASSFPDIANIPAADLFKFNFGSLTFTAADADAPFAIQYLNGQFNGFFFLNNFQFAGGNYQLKVDGGSFQVFQEVNGNPTGNSLMNGYVNIGNSSVTGGSPFTPTSPTAPVPEPSTWMMMLFGFGIVGFALRSRRRRPAFA